MKLLWFYFYMWVVFIKMLFFKDSILEVKVGNLYRLIENGC